MTVKITFKEKGIINNFSSGDIKNLGVSIRVVGYPSPFCRYVEGVPITCPVGMVLIHPVVVATKEVRVKDERSALVIFTDPVKDSIEPSLTNT
jgi:hypothetical protein